MSSNGRDQKRHSSRSLGSKPKGPPLASSDEETCTSNILLKVAGQPPLNTDRDACNLQSATDNKQCALTMRSDASTSTDSQPKRSCINMPLVPIKVILFAWYGAGATLLPYMTLHMKQLGLNMKEMTAIYAILPCIQLVGTPIAGFVADRTGTYKSVLQLSLFTCIVTTFLLQYIVPARDSPAPPGAQGASGAASSTSGASDEQAADSTAELLYMVTFWLYLIIRIFHQVAVGLSYVLLDTTTIILAEQNNSNYGRQRVWAILATGLFSPICGFIMDHYGYAHDKHGKKYESYDIAFYFFNALTTFTLYKVSTINVEIAELPRDVWKNVKPLLTTASVWIFLFAVFIMGSCWGFLESFLFVFLAELNAPRYLLGLTVTVGAFIGLPFLYESEWFAKKFGSIQLLLLALVVYFIRLVGYSFLDNPWWCLPYELMEAFTLHLMWVSTVRLAYEISPPGMLATLQAVVGGLNFGVGRGFGTLVGGSVTVFYGKRIAFRVIGCMALATAVLWAFLHYIACLKPMKTYDKKNITKPTDSIRRRRQTHKDVEASSPEITKAAVAS